MACDIKLRRLALLGGTFHQNLVLCIQHSKQGILRPDSSLMFHLGWLDLQLLQCSYAVSTVSWFQVPIYLC